MSAGKHTLRVLADVRNALNAGLYHLGPGEWCIEIPVKTTKRLVERTERAIAREGKK